MQTPQWQHDWDAHKCPLCSTAFNLFVRRHHCRKCGRVVCGSCCTSSTYIPGTTMASPTGPQRAHHGRAYLTCSPCADEIATIRRALAPNLDDHRSIASASSTTKYSTRTNTRRLQASTHSSFANDDASDHNICPICSGNLVQLYLELHKASTDLITTDDFDAFKEDHISSCLTAYDFNQSTSRYAANHPHNKMLVYNLAPIPRPQFEAIPNSGASVDTLGSVSTVKEKGDDGSRDKECVICLEELLPGDKVGRLECLCVFHYSCIKDWFNRKGYGECPVHYLHH